MEVVLFILVAYIAWHIYDDGASDKEKVAKIKHALDSVSTGLVFLGAIVLFIFVAIIIASVWK